MCTLIVATKVFENYPLVIAANRDELLDRPSEPPQLRNRNNVQILSPKDLQRGGTWLGVNEFGVFAALTNRNAVKSQRGKISRGDIIFSALAFSSAEEACEEYASKLVGTDFNGFFGVIADSKQTLFVHGDGSKILISERPAGWFVVSNHGVGTDSTGPQRVANVVEEIEWIDTSKEPTPERITSLLNLHDDWRYGTCINEPHKNYGTKSSAIIRLNNQVWDYWTRERVEDKHICEIPYQKLALPLRA